MALPLNFTEGHKPNEWIFNTRLKSLVLSHSFYARQILFLHPPPHPHLLTQQPGGPAPRVENFQMHESGMVLIRLYWDQTMIHCLPPAGTGCVHLRLASGFPPGGSNLLLSPQDTASVKNPGPLVQSYHSSLHSPWWIYLNRAEYFTAVPPAVLTQSKNGS